MENQKLEALIEGWIAPKKGLYSSEFVLAQKTVLDRLAANKSVSMADVAQETGLSSMSIANLFEIFKSLGAKTNKEHEIESYVISKTPTITKFIVKDHALFVGCIFDAIFLPALIDQHAEVRTICPITRKAIHLRVSPGGIDDINLIEATMSMQLPPNKQKIFNTPICDPTLHAECESILMFSSRQAASRWSEAHPNTTILSAKEAWQLAKYAWIDPFLNKLREAKL